MSNYNYLNIPTVSTNNFYISKNDDGNVKPPSSQLTVNDLHNELDSREYETHRIYEQILEKCHNHITNTNKKSNCKYTIYKIPIIQFGIPVYDVVQCAIFIIKDLIARGFKVKFQHPNMLIISWITRVKNIKIPQSNYDRNLLANTKEITYHPTDIKTLEYKTKNMFG